MERRANGRRLSVKRESGRDAEPVGARGTIDLPDRVVVVLA